jgi:hypothetical protein
MLGIIVPVSPRTNGCPEKSGAAQFEIRAPWTQAIALAGRARRHLDADDSLRLYALDRVGRQRSRVFGLGPRVEESAFWLL